MNCRAGVPDVWASAPRAIVKTRFIQTLQLTPSGRGWGHRWGSGSRRGKCHRLERRNSEVFTDGQKGGQKVTGGSADEYKNPADGLKKHADGFKRHPDAIKIVTDGRE